MSTCGDCKFYTEADGGTNGRGEAAAVCRRHPPTPFPLFGQHPVTRQPTILGAVALRPSVSKQDTCGEFAPALMRSLAVLPKTT